MQLVAYGAQDIYLTGNPQITFFKVVYRRHTNFSMEAIKQTFSGKPSNGASVTATISRNGDLVYKLYVNSSTEAIIDGDDIVSEVELEVGGQLIDRHYKEWNQILAELTTPETKALAFKNMTGALDHGLNSTGTTGVNMVQIPLNFWFCRNPGLALPLIALQYHEVKVKITLGTAPGTAGVQLWADYIYLDTDERRRFAQVSHEYLIEQLQKQTASASNSQKLNFNHPVKELIWTSAAVNAYGKALLKLNGHDRFAEQEEEYFQLRQPYDYHTAVPGANIPMADRPVMIKPITPSPSSALSLTIAPAATTGVTGANKFTIDADGSTENMDGSSGGTVSAHMAFYSTLDPDIKVGDILKLTAYDTNQQINAQVAITGAQLDGTSNDGNRAVSAQAGAFFTKSEIVTVIAVDSTISNRYAYKFEHNLAFIVTSSGDISELNLNIEIFGRIQDQKSRCSQLTKKINVYSFALKPEEHQPSGTCNFSRIDNAQLNTTGALATGDNIYAVNYNVLRIMSGMGGLAYSN